MVHNHRWNISNLKNTVSNDIPAKLFKVACKDLNNAPSFMEFIWNAKRMPTEWNGNLPNKKKEIENKVRSK